MEDLNRFRGKCILLFGDPMVGKSKKLVELSAQTERGFLFLWTDTNLFGEYGNQLMKLGKGEFIKIFPPGLYHKVVTHLELISMKDPKYFEEVEKGGKKFMRFKWDGIVIDSMTGIEEELTRNMKVEDPRRNLYLSRAFRTLTFYAGWLSKWLNIPIFLVCHAVHLFNETWKGLKVRPAFGLRALKNVDVVIYQYLEGDAPKWKIVEERRVIK